MRFGIRILIGIVVLAVAITGCSAGPATADLNATTNAADQIRAVLEKWPRDFAARDAAAVCGLFAPDSLIIYQNAPDKNYEALCNQLTRVLNDTESKYLYDAPDIKEILVSGDLATVRLIWTSRVTKRGEAGELVERENGVDILKRQPNGSWKIYISHAFAEAPPGGK